MKDVSRRSFLAGAAASGTLPLFNIGCVGFGRSRPRQIALGAKIRVALIGCGVRMRTLVELLMTENVVALVDPDPRMIARIKARMARVPGVDDLSKVRVFFDYRELFEKMGDELDAAVIATPNHHHALAAVMAMRRGIHVFVEKPLASTVEEAQMMGRVAKETGVVTHVGNFGHSTKAMRICVDAIRNGVIGEVRDVWCYDDRLNSMLERLSPHGLPQGMGTDVTFGRWTLQSHILKTITNKP